MAAGADLHDICKKIIGLDDSIRFAGIPNKFGKQIVVEYREGLEPFLTDQDYPILMLSFEIEADHESIILKKIIPFVKKELI